jgi:hypothetical protein
VTPEQSIDLKEQERADLLARMNPDARPEVEALLAQPAGSKLLDRPGWALESEPVAVPLASGAQGGQYRIESAIGAGGMGVVFRAYETKPHRPLVIRRCSSRRR